MAPLPQYGPYTPADGRDIDFTIIVKAAPERSARYGETVCTAGILDDGRLVRVYPVTWDVYRRGAFPKWCRVHARLVPSDEPAARPESHKLDGKFEQLDSPLQRVGGKTPWGARVALIAKAVNPAGVAGLRSEQAAHRTSLGVVKVKELVDFRITAPLDQIVDQADYRVSEQRTLTNTPIMEGSRVDKVKHVLRYRWRCHGTCCVDSMHDTTCEDWELFESFRSWRQQYPDDEEFLDALKKKYFDCMGQTDLHFMMGTPSNPRFQNSWMIVGLFYPNIKQRPQADLPTRCAKALAPQDVLKVDSSFDEVLERDQAGPATSARKGPLDRFT